MNRKDRDRKERVGTALQRAARWGLVAALASLLVTTGGCGDGSVGGAVGVATGGPPPPPTSPPPIGEVLVTVTVKDPFGAPVPGAEVRLLRSGGTGVSESSYFADRDGRAEIRTDSLTYGALVSAPDMEGVSYESTRRADDHLEITVTLHPIFGRVPAILGGLDIAMDVNARLESTVPGAFARGSLVVGTLRLVICPWDCDQSLDIPFAVRIP
jgi:hypothetical protein